jgi:hypothetical protein
MTSPAGIPNFLVEGSSIIQSSFGVNGLVQSPLVVAASLPTPWADYNYKSLAAVAHSPGWNVTPMVDGRGGVLGDP